MNYRDIVRYRLKNQQLSGSDFTTAGELVGWMGCIQAQDFGAAKWSIGSRITGIRDSDIEREFNEGRVLRTHILRPTWHFVSPEDIRWILQITATKIRKFNLPYYHRMGISDEDLKKSKTIFEKELKGGHQLTRTELKDFMNKKRVNKDDVRMAYHLMDAELGGFICSGARRGKQFTYTLLEDRVPVVKSINGDDAICELTKRYYQSRGPATVKDFCWWSGFSPQTARQGIEMNSRQLLCEKLKGDEYWFYKTEGNLKTEGVKLLPVYDEYTIGYSNRSAILDRENNTAAGSGIFKPVIIHRGKIAGV
jgi:hypothetical protein